MKFIFLTTICIIFAVQLSLTAILHTDCGSLCITPCYSSGSTYTCNTETGRGDCSPYKGRTISNTVCVNECRVRKYSACDTCDTGSFWWFSWDYCGTVDNDCTPAKAGHYYKQRNQTCSKEEPLRCNVKVRGVYKDCECEGYEQISRRNRDYETFSVSCSPQNICQKRYPKFEFENEKILCSYPVNSSSHRLYWTDANKFHKTLLDIVGPKICQSKKCSNFDLSEIDNKLFI